MLLYENSKLGVWLAANHPEARSFHRGLKETLIGYEQKIIGYERIITGYEQINIGTEEEPVLVDGPPVYGPGDPIYEDDLEQPIYEYGPDQFELIGWQEAWGKPPTEEELEAFQPPPPEENPVTDVEKLQQGIRTYREANEAAKEIIFTLMVKVAGALMAFELFTEDNVNAEGARFVAFHREPILDYKTAGRNAVSAQTLYASVASDASKAAFPWLEGGTGPTFLGLFASELGVTP